MATVMIVDDSATILMSIGEILAKSGLQVLKAKDGILALEQLKTCEKPSLIITDINMPNMGGIELIQHVRKLPGFRFTPILVLTTEQDATRRDAGKAAGATGWLVKPFSGSDLMKVVRQVLPGV